MRYLLILVALAFAGCGGSSEESAGEKMDAAVESAKETAGEMVDKTEEAGSDMADKAGDMADKAGDMADKAGDMADQTMKDAMEKAEGVEDTLMEKKDEVDAALKDAVGK